MSIFCPRALVIMRWRFKSGQFPIGDRFKGFFHRCLRHSRESMAKRFRGNFHFFSLAGTFVARSRLSLLLRGFPECPKRKITGKIALRLRSICRLGPSELDDLRKTSLSEFSCDDSRYWFAIRLLWIENLIKTIRFVRIKKYI